MLNCFRIVVILSCFFIIPAIFFPYVSVTQGAQSGSVKGVKENSNGSALTVTPREIDIGSIGPAEGAKASFILKNSGSGAIEWSVIGPEGWTVMETQKLGGLLQDKPGNLRIHISSLKEALHENTGKTRNSYPVQMTIETENRLVSYQKHLTPGAQRDKNHFCKI
jgi:hypothetical protein